MPRSVRLDDLTPEQRNIVLALIAAKSAEEQKPAPITDPVALSKLAGIIAPALRRQADRERAGDPPPPEAP